MPGVSIVVENLSKRYRIGQIQKLHRSRSDIIGDFVTRPIQNLGRLRRLSNFTANGNNSQDVIWALKDVSFEVETGEVLGIVGRNGAGKTTLLRILSRITEPTEGHAQIRGRVGHLLEIGTGFHPELTGRENVYLNGAVLGMTRKEIRGKFDEIISFAEVERFVDTPMKRFSTGMAARLAFSVAAHLEPEILLVDEVLSVGDASFQQKCLGKMDVAAKEGRTVLFVSHNMATLTRLCTRAIWIEGGRIKLTGSPGEVVGEYLSSGEGLEAAWIHPPDHCSDRDLRLTSARVLNFDDQATAVVPFNEQLKLEIAYEVIEALPYGSVSGRLTDSHGNVVLTSFDTDTNEWAGRVRLPGRYLSVCNVPADLLRPGRYHLTVGSRIQLVQRDARVRNIVSNHENVLAFGISEVGYPMDMDRPGIVTPPLEWDVKCIDERWRPVSDLETSLRSLP